jgi:hypothetical protein
MGMVDIAIESGLGSEHKLLILTSAARAELVGLSSGLHIWLTYGWH